MSKLVKWSLPALAFAVMVALIGARAAAAQEKAAEAAAKVKVSGVVLTGDGSPAAGARVRLLPPPAKKGAAGEGDTSKKPAPQAADDAAKPGPDAEKPTDKPAEKPKRPRVQPVAETTTDADGKYQLEAPAGKYRLMASLRGSGNASKTITLKDGKDLDNVELKLKPAARKAPAAPAPAQ